MNHLLKNRGLPTIGLFIVLTHTAYAAPTANSSNSAFYYDIGGARSISSPLNVNANSYDLGGSSEFGLGYSCGKFDPTLGLSNILNSITSLGTGIVNGAVGAVTSAIGGLPSLVLQRVNPGLYDLFQNAKIGAEATLALADQSCEQYESDIRAGQNPYSDWTDLSKVMDWKVQMGSGGFGSASSDVNEAKKTVETNNGKNGIPWLEGTRSGGQGQGPIKLTNDIVQAGYNLSLNRPAATSSAPSATTRLTEVWSSPAQASAWAVEVLGDIHIRTNDNHATETNPGHGLTPKIQKEITSISTDMTNLVNGSTPLTVANVTAVSSEDTLINYDVIKAVRELEPSERVIAISKLSSEVAMSRTLEKALFLRRIMLTGLREPNISKAPPAMTYGQEAITILDKEIDNILFEKRIRTELASKTASIILSLQEQTEKRGKLNMKAPDQDINLIKEGATN